MSGRSITDSVLRDTVQTRRVAESIPTLRRALVFGASGQIGSSLLTLLHAEGIAVRAVSRRPHAHANTAGLQWMTADLNHADVQPITAAQLDQPSAGGDLSRVRAQSQLPRDCDVVFSLGPLDAFARWQDRAGPVAPRVVAFGSTSMHSKHASSDQVERDLSRNLGAAEDILMNFGARHGVAVSILRPTLVYGCGRDRTLTRIATMARRHGAFMLPRSATGLRQPVHVEDLSIAALACARHAICGGRAYDVPGGEVVGYREMVSRVFGSLQPKPRLVSVPDWVFRASLRVANTLGALGDAGRGVLERLDQDLVFDNEPARRDFSYAPRAFHCDAAMFEPTQQFFR